jgi:CubicO group peptidase (beta-lactamase class C family)
MKHPFQQVFDIVSDAVKKGYCPGAAVAVGCRSKVLAEGYFGAMSAIDEPFRPVIADTIYDMASISKILATTTIFLKDFDEGLLSPDLTIKEFYPDAPPDKRDITLAQLMTHTAGIKPWFLLEKVSASPSCADHVILNTPLIALPGTKVVYSDLGFILLGRILEKVHGKRLTELAVSLVFEPLGMRDTGYSPDSSRCAPTESEPITGKWIRGVVHDENARYLMGNSGNAGVFSTLHDMERFVSMLANNGRVHNDVFLSENVVKLATRNYTPSLNENRGLGFKLQGGIDDFIGPEFGPRAFGHTGFTGTSFAIDPDTGFYVILLSNRVHPTRENNRFSNIRVQVHRAAKLSWCSEKG